MGKPSDVRHSARRPGKRERARIKNFRGSFSTHVSGVGTVRVKYGRKKFTRFYRFIERCREAHQAGNLSNMKIHSFVKRPDYTTGERTPISKVR